MCYARVLLFFILFVYGSRAFADTVTSSYSSFLSSSSKSNWLSVPRLSGSYRRPFTYKAPGKFRLTHALGTIAHDMFWVNAGLFSWDTFKIFVSTVPFYVASRMTDEKLQNCFFDHKSKKNKNEPAQWCKEVARLSIGVPIALLGIQSVVSSDEELRATSQVFLTGMPFVLLAKDIIKKLDFDVCKRPWHEKFAKEQRQYGGFPSGHLAEASYMAVLYGMRFGPAFAVPLGGVALFVTCVFLSSNRHYLSQMVAGASFGAMYALSANKLVESKLAKRRDMRLGLSVNESGGPTMSLSLKF